MRLHGATASHVGNLREANQDRVWFKGSVAALADGMGGHQGGERAAELAIGEFKIMPEVLTPAELIDVVEEANRQVHHQSVNPELRGMGTTMVALGLHENQLLVVNVGDSRAYLLRDESLAQITVDHSFVEELVRQGRLTPEEAAIHPQRNIVTRALGIGPDVDVDEFPLEPELGDRYLLASDGLFGEVPKEQIRRIMVDGDDPAEVAVMLVEAALETPCRDNVTVAVVDVVDDDFVAPDGYRPEQTIETDTKEITAPVPVVASDVVKITDRPPQAAGGGVLLERERTLADSDVAYAYADSDPATGRKVVIPATDTRAGRSTIAKLLASLLVVGGLVAAVYFGVNWYASTSYFVDEVEGQLVIYQGQKGGLLWAEPQLLDYRSGVSIVSLTPDAIATYEDWGDFDSIDQARTAIEDLAALSNTTEAGAGGDTGTDAAVQTGSGAGSTDQTTSTTTAGQGTTADGG